MTSCLCYIFEAAIYTVYLYITYRDIADILYILYIYTYIYRYMYRYPGHPEENNGGSSINQSSNGA